MPVDERWVMCAAEGGICPACHEDYEPDDDVVHDSMLDGWVHLECGS